MSVFPPSVVNRKLDKCYNCGSEKKQENIFDLLIKLISARCDTLRLKSDNKYAPYL